MPNLELTNTEAMLLNTLYAMMVAGFNQQMEAVEGSFYLVKRICSGMKDDEMVALNKKMSSIIRDIPKEYLKSIGIDEEAYDVTTLNKKYGEVLNKVPDESKRTWN